MLFKTEQGLIETNAPESIARNLWKTYHTFRYDFCLPFHQYLQGNGFSAKKVHVPSYTCKSTEQDLSMN
jgi:hypothetical protein